MFLVKIYIDSNGFAPYESWLSKFDLATRARIQARILRLKESGSFGNRRSLGSKLFELKFKCLGGSIRIYYYHIDAVEILILCGGNKGSQKRDILKARDYLKSYLEI